MALVIWKYSILEQLPTRQGSFHLEMPVGVTVLTVQVHWAVPTIWALVDPEVRKIRHEFVVLPTDRRFDMRAEGLFYCGTFRQAGGGLIWHLFGVPCLECRGTGVSSVLPNEPESSCPTCAIAEPGEGDEG